MPDKTKRHLESALGYGIGCAVLGVVALIGLAIFGLVAVAMPMTLSIVLGTLSVLAFLGWRRRRQATDSSRASMSSSDRPK
ncbi:hypothetical protein VQ042_03160 [Aurantimonas sp. A2-1-M11]|uniref:hypothetical protein n=1 Tax=Aurantimonas sp. A2-1-M11 TaxID=3113712 RepID=UPI002F9356C2